MSKLRIILAAAVVALSAPAFAMSAGTAGAGGGGTGGGGTGGGAGGGGNNPAITTYAVIPGGTDHPHPKPVLPSSRQFSASCAKQEPVYNRYGYVVGYQHGVDCWQ